MAQRVFYLLPVTAVAFVFLLCRAICTIPFAGGDKTESHPG
jgi:hypothetical protein